MSVTTRFDELLSEAREDIDNAINKLLEASKPGTWGPYDYTDEYMDNVANVMSKLIKLRRKI